MLKSLIALQDENSWITRQSINRICLGFNDSVNNLTPWEIIVYCNNNMTAIWKFATEEDAMNFVGEELD